MSIALHGENGEIILRWADGPLTKHYLSGPIQSSYGPLQNIPLIRHWARADLAECFGGCKMTFGGGQMVFWEPGKLSKEVDSLHSRPQA